MNTKPGYRTSEFWISLAPWILALVVLVGMMLGSMDAEFAKWLIGALAIGGGVSNYGYSKSRAEVKYAEADYVSTQRWQPGSAAVKSAAAEDNLL